MYLLKGLDECCFKIRRVFILLPLHRLIVSYVDPVVADLTIQSKFAIHSFTHARIRTFSRKVNSSDVIKTGESKVTRSIDFLF